MLFGSLIPETLLKLKRESAIWWFYSQPTTAAANLRKPNEKDHSPVIFCRKSISSGRCALQQYLVDRFCFRMIPHLKKWRKPTTITANSLKPNEKDCSDFRFLSPQEFDQLVAT